MCELPNSFSFKMICGERAVLAEQRALAVLAEQTDQRGLITYLEFILSANRFGGSKVPCLLTLLDQQAELCAAVLLYEYRPWGAPTRIFATADYYGVRSVVAPADMRSTVAQEAARFLIRQGAWVVMISVRKGNFSPEIGRGGLTLATRARILSHALPLRPTFDETVAAMGARTRRNLRATHRRVESQLGGTFVLDPEVSERDFLAINRACMYPVPPAIAKWRFRCARELPGRLFGGLRAKNGRWLSLVGGRHLDGTTFIDWQMNVCDLPSWSIGTAMRAYILKHEIERGASFLAFEGGTPHSMNRAFLQEEVSDLLLARPFLSPAALRTVLPLVMPKASLLAQMVASDSVIWHGNHR